MIKHLAILFFLSFQINIFSQSQFESDKLDSIISLRKLSTNEEISLENRLIYAKRSSELAYKLDIDTTILMSNKYLSLMYFNTDKDFEYVKINKNNVLLASKLKDTLAQAVANLNLGSHYQSIEQNDSAYYFYSKAIKQYSAVNDKQNKAIVLLNIADIQLTEKDYLGCEENTIRAIRLFEELPKSEFNLDNLWILNGFLGIISRELKNFDNSINYFDKAIDYADEMNDGFLNKAYSINSKAFVYRQKKDFKKSLELYESLLPLRSSYEADDPTFYALIIDNIAYTKFVAGHKDYDVIEDMFMEAYEISADFEDDVTKMAVCIDLSKFYIKRNDNDQSLKYVTEAYNIASRLSSNEILLDALMILSQLKEGEDGKRYLYKHIKLTDSLLNVERNVGNKFARIEFETDKVEQENEKMTQQRMWLLVISAGLLVTLFLLYIIITQRAKNKELKFEKDQQKANEEIYNLMLSQQDKVDEARANEKIRISKELHDGILGRLFGTRLVLDSANISEGKEAIDKRATYISELKVIEDDIRKISHDLNTDFVSGSGFMDIVSELIEKQTNAYQLQSSFDFTDDIHWEIVPNKTKINIYRIIQESLQNIYKHANAKAVKISFELKNNVICLSIIDDGDGFNVNKSKKGIGIKNINSRVEEVEGKAQFHSEVNKGTEVIITIPYKN